jgi:hypothetical protein
LILWFFTADSFFTADFFLTANFSLIAYFFLIANYLASKDFRQSFFILYVDVKQSSKMKIFDYSKKHYWTTNSKNFFYYSKKIVCAKKRVINIEYRIRRIIIVIKTFYLIMFCYHLNIDRNDIINQEIS